MTNPETKDRAADAAQPSAPIAPKKALSKKGVSRKKIGPKGQAARKAAAPKKEAKPVKKVAKPAIEVKPPVAAAVQVKAEGKGAMILRLIARGQGAALPEIMKATSWLPHSVRGFISTASKKRLIESTKGDAGERTYKLVD
jgi:Protein of unknown function (DUF3489)